jgi:hypothetical protein
MELRGCIDFMVAAATSLILAGCAGTSEPGGPQLPSTLAVPDLRGTWTGTWGGTPLTLVVLEQKEVDTRSGVYVGPVQVLGQRVPGVVGVMTSVIDGSRVSASVEGWLTTSARGGLALLLSTRTLEGRQWLTLAIVESHRLVGRGESEFRWGPRGAVELIRSAAQAS